MKISILTLCACLLFAACKDEMFIDRKELICRHTIHIDSLDVYAPLSVGNGSFCYTADVTGMQTIPNFYANAIPITTMAEWGWHSFPDTNNSKLSDTYEYIELEGRQIPYCTNIKHPSAGYLRANPHQSNLAHIGLNLTKNDGSIAMPQDIKGINQDLDIWKGVMTSHFKLENTSTKVISICHPEQDQLSFKIHSDLFLQEQLQIKINFPYVSTSKETFTYQYPEKHTTYIVSQTPNEVILRHVLDSFSYLCKIVSSENFVCKKKLNHHFEITPANKVNEFSFSVLFTQDKEKLKPEPFEQTLSKNIKYWKDYWNKGGAVDLSASTNPNWKELERRLVLSQYLTAIQSRQKYPPQETGLTCNSWYGKFHLEMHWWHSVHFALWGRTEYLEKTLDYYPQILKKAKDMASAQAYKGARWPKMIGPNGIESPSYVGPYLIWQQPHPIYFAELIFQQNPTKEILKKYSEIISETAEFMASYAIWNNERNCYELKGALSSAREYGYRSYKENKNPTYELAYWEWGLLKANEWRERMGMERVAEWDKIANNMAPWPIENGIYVEQEQVLVKDGGHPCMLAAYGLLPETSQLDKKIMRNTLYHVINNWPWEGTWGWDYPMIAMTATRLGENKLAMEALLKDVTKNTYLKNGHNFQKEYIPIYLPGNGGLLSAMAMICTNKEETNNGKGELRFDDWTIKYEGLMSTKDKAAEKIVVDSKLDDWNKNESTKGLTNPWHLNTVDSTYYNYEISNGYFYFYFTTIDSTLTITPFTTEWSITECDRVELFFSPNKDLSTYYCAEISPTGDYLDYSAEHYRKFDDSWDFKSLVVSTSILENKYIVEGKISLSELKSMKLYDDIYIGVFRADFQGKEKVDWYTKTIPDSETPDFHISSAFEKIILK